MQIHAICEELMMFKNHYKPDLRTIKKLLLFIKKWKFTSDSLSDDEIVEKAVKLVYFSKFNQQVRFRRVFLELFKKILLKTSI